jgi:uncharacterized membrane protein YecN with MAPEG domain
MTVTPFYAGILAIWFFVLSIRVVRLRLGPQGPSLGDGGNSGLQRRIRAHANFAEYVPLVVVLMAFIELSGYPKWVVHCLGGVLLLGRLLHGYALSFSAAWAFGRSAGIGLTFLALLIAGIACIAIGLRQAFG